MDRTNIIEAGKFLTAVLTNKNVAAQAVFADAHRLGTQRPWESEQPHNVTPVAQDAIAAIAEKALRVGFDTALSLFQWRDVADGLPEVEGMYLFKRKGEAGSEAEQYWYNPNCSTAKKARICEEYQALFGPIPPYKEQR